MTVGIICEYNPLHLGHKKQLDTLRRQLGDDQGIVCLMSGDFVQRGAPAIVDKMSRAKAAILSGADLVLELPVTAALSRDEVFAAGGVGILSGFCHSLCFGAETPDPARLMGAARALLSPDFSPALHDQLDQGKSFPAARAGALEAMGLNGGILRAPNNILAVEYCKAILAQNSPMTPLPILREGGYHDREVNDENPSATAVRALMIQSGAWLDYVPPAARPAFQNAVFHSKEAGERAILARLRTLSEPEFQALPYGSEGLWRKLMHAVREEAALEEIAQAVKSKRYTRTRIDRMILCAFLGLTQQDLEAPIPYTRVLAFNDRGRDILKTARESGEFPNIGEKMDHPYQAIENRCGDLYGLFAQQEPEKPGQAARSRVYCHKG